MDILGGIIQPDMAVIHNVGPVHLEGFKTVRGVAEEKAALLSHLRAEGRAVISSDYPELSEAAGKYASGRTVRFSLKDASAAYFGEYLGPSEHGGGRYRLELLGREAEVCLGYSGGFLLENILAAAASACELGGNPEAVSRGLERAELPEHRCRLQQCGRFLIVDDCYNANPMSMRQAVSMAREAARGEPFWAVLGDMKELGEGASAEHEELGRYLAEQGLTRVFFIGEHAEDVRRGFAETAPADRVREIASEADLAREMERLGLEGGTVLIKGSRGCRMERFVQALAGGFGP
jgi:UDP-N-acetylmuramoyl-tripeptide--D-alanyl-D-alanine ligase